jgi:hypothetical protein
MPSEEDIANLHVLLATHRRRLADLLRQRAGLGDLYAPPALFEDIRDARHQIARIKKALLGWGITVEQLPDDLDSDDSFAHVFAGAGVPPHLFESLKHILSATTWFLPDLVSAYRTSAPPRYARLTLASDVDTVVATIISALAGASGVIPLLTFVERLARMPAAIASFKGMPIAISLHNWVNQAAHQVGLAPTELKELRAKMDQSVLPGSLTNPYLLFAAIPSLQQRGRFRTQAWFWADELVFCLHVDDTPCVASQLPRTIDHLLNEIASYQMVAMDELSIALFLPLEHLNIDLARWKIKFGRIDVPLPSSYPIMLRSLERIYQDTFKKTWPIWERNWCAVNHPPEQAAIWHDTADTPSFDQLTRAVLLTITLAPPILTDKQRKEILTTSISAGTPIVLWLKEGAGTPDEIRQELEPLLKKDLDQLPRRLFERRQQAKGAAPWPQIMLLLDDPERRPIIATRLRSPRQG